MNSSPRTIVATAALPYANGPIHMGHLVEYTQADIWTRFQKMRGHECLYICADDTHGTPIMVEARKRGITPEALIDQAYKEHVKDFTEFEIIFDNYYSTNSPENQKRCEDIYLKIKANNHTTTRKIDQLYCEHDKMFLPDRFVKGTCPKCGSADQNGDSCDKCGSTYSPEDLKSPYCIVCKNTPTTKASENIFFKLDLFRDFLKEWIPNHAPTEISNKLQEWLAGELKDWDISRDEPYFGFKIPGTNNKYFYVWVDAPMGYMSSLENWCKKHNKDINHYWSGASKAEVYHFIGKDIVNFHALFWPAILKSAGIKTPDSLFVHGHLTLNGEKMSKSKGNFYSARQYLNYLNPLHLRYYFASKLGPTIDDLDLNLEDYQNRVNAELIGKITNLASRGAQMLTKKLDSHIGEMDAQGTLLLKNSVAKSSLISDFYEKREFAKAINEIRMLADEANKYFDEMAPWKTVGVDDKKTHQVISTTLNIFRIIAIYLKPVLPSYSEKVAKLFNESPYNWNDINKILKNHKINDYEHLMVRVDADKVKALIEDGKKSIAQSTLNDTQSAGVKTKDQSANSLKSEGQGPIEFDDFSKIDLRIAQIIEAEEIKEADKLLRLKVDIGGGKTKQIIAGIKSAYSAASLVGRHTVIVNNLKPRQMKFGISEGMVLAAGDGGKDLFILSPDSGAKAGDKVK